MNNEKIKMEVVKKWMNSLSEEEKESILKYSLEGEISYYERINNHLRGIKEDFSLERYIKNIDSALNKFSLEEDIEVYRAQGIGDISDVETIKIEDIYETYKYVKNFLIYKNYISTSINKEAAINHLKYLYFDRFYNFGMIINGNLRANTSCGYIKYLSAYEIEEELLIMRNKKFNISKVGIFNKRTIELFGEFEELEG